MLRKRYSIIFLALFFLAGCTAGSLASAETGNNIFRTPTGLTPPTPTPKTIFTPQPDPFTVASLRARTYGAGDLLVDRLWYTYDNFDRYYIIYDSDGLKIHGYVNVPRGEESHPVIVMLHGWIPRDEYDTLDYTLRYADDLANAGYIVLHPNLRSFPPSDSGPPGRDYHAGYAIDVLNLLAHVSEMAGEEGIFKTADLERLGIWGHSIGGSIAMRVVSVKPQDFKAVLLYAPVSQRYGGVVPGSEVYDLTELEAPISIHHGDADQIITVDQTYMLCDQLVSIGKNPECFYYEDQPHTLYADQWADPLFMQRTVEFFDKYLK